MSTPRRRKRKTASKQNNKQAKKSGQADTLPHLPNSEGSELRRREIHRVLSEEFDHPGKDKEYRPGWSTKRLAELVGYSELTVKRTIQYMRKTLMLPIGYNRKRDRYYYKERVAAFPTTQVSEGELICLCGMIRAMEPFKNTPFVQKLRPLIDKFIEGMPPELRVSFRTLEQRISFRSTGLDAHLDPAAFEAVIAALLKDQELAIDYVKMHYEEGVVFHRDDATPATKGMEDFTAADVASAAREEDGNGADVAGRSRRERRDSNSHEPPTSAKSLHTAKLHTASLPPPSPIPERRTIEPVHLACVDNGWYLFAYDPSREKIRRFLLTRTKAVRKTGRAFKPRAFDIDQVMAPSFGIFDGDGVPVDLRIRFREKGVRLIQERRWHHSEKFETLADGTVVLSMQVAHTPQVEGWILHWGSLAKVLEPAAVRDAVERQARDILEPWLPS